MAIAQHRPIATRSEPTVTLWQTDSASPRPMTTKTISNRIPQPLIFSIDDRFDEQHLTKFDLCSKNLKKIDKLPNNIQFNVVLFDHNEITKIEHLDTQTHLIQLSISYNRLIDIRLLSRLRTLQKLNLSNNSLDSIDSLKTLQNLVILDISSNNIQNIGALNNCRSLQFLNASDNSIRQIEDLSHLLTLKYLNLRKNLIDSLISVPKHCPKSIHTLDISDNEIKDLTEIGCLSSLINLNTLHISNNPCLYVIDDRHGCHQPFDYRSYVLNWNLTVHDLDEIPISRKESLKAEWLLSQGKGRSFRPGEHNELVQYLIRVCGTDADERDDLHLSRIMLQQDLYQKNKNNFSPEDESLKTFDTMKDANDTLTKDTQSKLKQSLLVSESEFVKISPTSSIDESHYSIRAIPDDHSSNNRYSDYDNRPIKPLDRNILQTKLSEYPCGNVENNIARPRTSTNPSKITPREPIIMRPKSHKPASTRTDQTKRHTIAATDTMTLHTITRTCSAATTTKSKRTTNEDEEIQPKSAPINATGSTQNTANSVDLKKLSSSIETIRTSVLQAYLNLHERFTKTTELQTSALAALWKKFETENLTHQSQTKELVEENRRLSKRLHELESRLNIQTRTLYPPLHAHISKRDTKSFFLHWTLNPLNASHSILGYRIYIDDILKHTVDAMKTETIIDSIREEGEFRIKLRTYDVYGESEDSNVVITRYRRHGSNSLESNAIQRTQSDHLVENTNPNQLRQTQSQGNLTTSTKMNKPIEVDQSMGLDQHQSRSEISTTPDQNQLNQNEHISPIISSPSHSNSNDSITRLKSPGSSPSHQEKSTAHESISRIFVTKRSPTRAGIMSRFAKSPHRINGNNVLLNALPINLTPSPIEMINSTQSELHTHALSNSMVIPSQSKNSLDPNSL